MPKVLRRVSPLFFMKAMMLWEVEPYNVIFHLFKQYTEAENVHNQDKAPVK
jgi:hypothetical protein